MNPHARQDNLVVQEVGDELVVYDKERYRTHRLNRTAALVWRHCDGHTTLADLAALLQRELNVSADEGLVWLALDRLEKAHLLRERLTRPRNAARLSRRQVLRKLGLTAAAVLAPVVTSLVAPKVARAQQQAVYCQYKIVKVLKPCDITKPMPVPGMIVCAQCIVPKCPTLPKSKCFIHVTVLGKKVRCHVELQQAPLNGGACLACPAANSIIAGITC